MPPTLTEAREAIQTKYIDRPEYAEGIIKCLRRFNDTQLYERTKAELERYGYYDEQIRVAGVWYKRMRGVKI
jgi:hypothetical protein